MALFGVLLLVHAFLSELVERFVSNSQTPSIPTIAINQFEHMFTCGQLVCSPASEITWSSFCSGYQVNTVMKFVPVMTVLHSLPDILGLLVGAQSLFGTARTLEGN